MEPIAITVAGADPDNAAKKALDNIKARDIPPLTLPTIEFARSTNRLDIPPFVIKFPASTKNAIAIKDVDSNPPKIRCGITAVVIAKSGLNTIDAMVAAPKAIATGTPPIRNSAKHPNNNNPVISTPPLPDILPFVLQEQLQQLLALR